MSEPTKSPGDAFFEAIRLIVREEIGALNGHNGQAGEDRLLTAEQAAPFLGVSPGWLYKHHSTLPFVVKLHRKMLRFSNLGLQRYITAKKTKGGP